MALARPRGAGSDYWNIDFILSFCGKQKADLRAIFNNE